MAANKSRYRRFRDDLKALQQGLSRKSYLVSLQSKLLDFIARANPSPDDLLRIRQAVTTLVDDDFEPFAARVIASYNETLAIVNTHYADLGVDLTQDHSRIQAIERANRADLGRYRESTIRRISQATREALLAGETAREFARRIAPASNRARFYALTLAQTQTKVVARAAKAEKARIAEVHYFEYVGIIRDATRDFCRDLLIGQSTYHIDAIHQMRNGNKEPVIENGGGWNCIHDWEPDPFYSPP